MAMRKGAAHAANILEVLVASPRPLSAYDLLDRLRSTGIAAPLTVYRALDKLIEAGKVHRIESLNAFIACQGSDHHGHDHASEQAVCFAICDRCGTVDEFADPRLPDSIQTMLSAKAFSPRKSVVEVHGLCAACNTAVHHEAAH